MVENRWLIFRFWCRCLKRGGLPVGWREARGRFRVGAGVDFLPDPGGWVRVCAGGRLRSVISCQWPLVSGQLSMMRPRQALCQGTASAVPLTAAKILRALAPEGGSSALLPHRRSAHSRIPKSRPGAPSFLGGQTSQGLSHSPEPTQAELGWGASVQGPVIKPAHLCP